MNKHSEPKSSLLSMFCILFPFIFTIVIMIITAAFVVFRYASDKAYGEKWKEYNECGLG